MDKRALLVNDSRFETLILKDMLQRLDYSVEVADEFEALYAIERYEPQVVIVNYIMQQTRGDKLIQLMKAGMPDIKCILSTNSNIHMSDFPNGSVDGILHTPVSQFLLESVIRTIESQIDDDEGERICKNCNKDLTPFDNITFCPFCGTLI